MSETQKPKSGRLVKVILILSLGINLAIAGVAIGAWTNQRPARPPNPDAIAFLSFALPKEHRSALRKQLVERRAELRANRAALASMRRHMIEALEAEPFEIDAVEVVLQRQRDRFLELGNLAHSALLERISLLNPEEREVYIASLKRGLRRLPE